MGIGNKSPGQDMFTTYDLHYEGSIGGLGTQLETTFGSTRRAPLFEFRDLTPQKAQDFEKFMDEADSSIQKLHNKVGSADRVKRDGGACSPTQSITPAPKPTCNVQDQDPGLGITSEGCICQGSSTWPALSTSSGATHGAQCNYTAPPSNSVQATITAPPLPAQTSSQICMVCTPLRNGEGICASMPSCTPQTAYATATVNSSPLHYGTLSQDELYTGVSNALEAACTSLSTGTTTVSGEAVQTVACDRDGDYQISSTVPYVSSSQFEHDGKLSVNIGSYAATEDPIKALIHMAASMVKTAANSSEQSCYEMEYQQSVISRRGKSDGFSLLGPPSLLGRDHLQHYERKMRLCNGPAVVVASYWAPGYQDRIGKGNVNPTPDAQLTALFKFTKSTSGDFFCELAATLAKALMTELLPELEPVNIIAAEQLEIACENAMQNCCARSTQCLQHSTHA